LESIVMLVIGIRHRDHAGWGHGGLRSSTSNPAHGDGPSDEA
jgi:hypothetical protein